MEMGSLLNFEWCAITLLRLSLCNFCYSSEVEIAIFFHRKDGGIPEDVTVEKDILRFNRPLRLTDKGVYRCVATNIVGSGTYVDMEIEVTGMSLCFKKCCLCYRFVC